MTLEFQADGHVYRLDGREVPSVTQVLTPYMGLEHVDPHVLARAAEFGTHVHEACHLFNVDELDRDALDPALAPYVAGWEKFLADTGAVVILSEHRVASRKFGFAGTLDTAVAWGKTTRLIDLKTGTVVPRTVGPQTAAYSEAHHEETGERLRLRYCLHLKGDGTYKLHPLTNPSDWHVFHAALVIHNWQGRKAA